MASRNPAGGQAFLPALRRGGGRRLTALVDVRALRLLGELVGVYSRADERVVLIVFQARAFGVGSETDEATEVRAFAPENLPWDDLAFWSTTAALRDALAADAR